MLKRKKFTFDNIALRCPTRRVPPEPITTKMKKPSTTGPTGSLDFLAEPSTMPVPRLCTFSWNLPDFAFATRLEVVCVQAH